MISEDINVNGAYVKVSDTARELCLNFRDTGRRKFNIPVVGLTGSVGKNNNKGIYLSCCECKI